MAFPHSHKTVIVLDRSPYMLNSCQQFVEFDVFVKSRAPGMIPLAPIAKNMWTCTVEATIEFIRIIYDIYPSGKLICAVLSDASAVVLNSWNQQEQSLTQFMNRFAQLGPPSRNQHPADCNIVHGLNQAIEMLCTPSDTQLVAESKLSEEDKELPNRGRVICVTNITSESHVLMLEDCIQNALSEHNKLAAATDGMMPIDHCELSLVHVIPVGTESAITKRDLRPISGILSSEINVSQSGTFIASTLVDLAVKYYNLGSTTVTGIPMKEEQNAASSANYDVELLHAMDAHDELFKSGFAETLKVKSKEGLASDTVALKWCTPKSSSVELHPCTSAYRITPVDVNSRPSSCLTNFLLNGRAVMLEQPRKTGARVISHMLASHGGEIYLHTLNSSRMPLEDPPSISEGCGGRVTDYRINDFVDLMKTGRLAPSGPVAGSSELPVERAHRHLDRLTRNWPMVISDTIIFNMLSQIDPLPFLIVKEHLTEDDVLECKKAIYHVVGMEARNEPLPIVSTGTRGKGPKREEQYRQMWGELERLLQSHASTSPDHQLVLDCLLECRKPMEDGKPRKGSVEKIKEEKPDTAELEKWKDSDKSHHMTERERDVKTEVRPDSPPSKLQKLGLEHAVRIAQGKKSLLSLWNSKVKVLHSQRHAEFAGRVNSDGPKAELYPNLQKKEPNGDPPKEGILKKTT